MPYIVVDNFSGGLDKRRHVLNSKPGTLAVLKNAHVTRGGEIEKRKAFVQAAQLPYQVGVIETFGLEATQDGVFVFGSLPSPTMPAGVFYQRLQHPFDPFFNMTAVTWSTVYGGKTFVIAEFSDNKTYAFFDGVAIKDWYEGVVRNNDPGASIVDDFNLAGYSAAVIPNPNSSAQLIEITGPVGKDYSLDVTFTGSINPVVTKTQDSEPNKSEVLSKAVMSITSGAETPAKCDEPGQFLRNIDPAALPDIKGIYVNGIEVTGIQSSAAIRYNDYPEPNGEVNNAKQLGSTLATYINNNSATSKITAFYNWNGGGYSKLSPGTLFIKASIDEGPDANGWEVWIEFASTPNATPYVSELIDTGSTVVSPYNPGRYVSKFGTMAGGAFNAINSIKIDGVEVLGSPVKWESSNSDTMSQVATKINGYTSVPNYTASVNENEITISAAAGTGSAPNGRSVVVQTVGNVVVPAVLNMSGGTDPVVGVAKKYTVELLSNTSPYPNGDTFRFIITDPENPTLPSIVGASRVTGKTPAFSLTYKSKEYVGSGSTLFFSAVNDATLWDIYDTGAGFIDMSNNFGGREALTGIGVYQDRLAVFSRRNIQLWFMDPDPARNSQYQIMANTGCIAPGSIASIGAIDTLYLSDSGIRSIRARENTDSATSNDIGSAIDDEIAQQKKTGGISGNPLLDATVYRSTAVIEPVDGRYWLAVYDKIYVLSYYPSANISAWSTYEPGFVVEEMVSREDEVFIRSGNYVYVYGKSQIRPAGHIGGGAGGYSEYDDCEVIVELPYLDGNKPATFKQSQGIDLTCEGIWSVEVGFDHTAPGARDTVAIVGQSTYATGKIPMTGYGTHFGMRFRSQDEGYAKLASIIVHFDEMHSKHDAG